MPLSLLDPRVLLIALVLLAGGFGAGYFKGDRNGAKRIQAQWNEATAAANLEAQKLERARQSAVDAAARAGAARASRISADDTRAADAVRGLRNALSARRVAEESAAAATERADTLGKLLVESAEAYRELALRCDRHVNDLRTVLEAWPR